LYFLKRDLIKVILSKSMKQKKKIYIFVVYSIIIMIKFNIWVNMMEQIDQYLFKILFYLIIFI